MTDRTPRPCLHARARHQHGTALAFAKDGCRCWPCAHAYRRKAKETAYRTASGTPVTVATRDAVRAVYDELSATPPVRSRASTRARGLAARRGWASPLAWDDDVIDDPAARPDAGHTRDGSGELLDEVAVHRAMRGDRSVRLRKAERAEVIRRLVALGLNDQQIERRTGISSRTALRTRHAEDVGA